MPRALVALALTMTLLCPCLTARGQSYTPYSSLGPDLLAVENAYPSIAKRYVIGTSVQGRSLWALRISDNVGVEEDEPEFKYISSMHGDEILGMQMCIYLIDELTMNYGTDPRITNLVDEVDIWIMPLMNPDGYDRSPRSRTNANGVDLNRDFPDYGEPDSPTGRQVETVAIMNWLAANSFTLSANLHGGALVVNYPYDNYLTGSNISPDDAMFRYISEEYSQHNLPMWNSSSFFHGITNGADWYVVYGSMQDYNYHFWSCNEVTIELGDTKQPPASQLPTYWSQNEESMLSYMETCLIGVRGLVTDAGTGSPIAATVAVSGNSHDVYTDPHVGDYHRMLMPGTYSLTFSAPGYIPVTVNNVVVTSGPATRVDVTLGDGPPMTQDVYVDLIGEGTIALDGSDPNLDPIDFIITSLPTNGQISDPGAGVINSVPYTLANGGDEVYYTADPGYTGPDGFDYKATDYGTPPDGGESEVATVYVTVLAPLPQIMTSELPDGVYGAPYGPMQLTATGGEPSLTWSMVTDVPYVEADMGGSLFAQTGTAQGWAGDDSFWTYALPFTFPFYNEDETSIRVWSNGFIDFGAFDGSSYNNGNASLISNRMIAPLWDDLRTDRTGTDIHVDASVAGQVTIRWSAVTYSGLYPTNFAVTLMESGAIQFHYGSGNSPISATVGISSGDGSRYHLAGYNGVSPLTDANSLEFEQPDGLPEGISLSPAGVLSGTPSEWGSFQPNFRLTDGIGRTDEAMIPLTILETSPATGDYDGDGDVDLGDFAAFQWCYGQPATGACGDAFDIVPDGTIDMDDFNGFEANLVGP